MIFYSNQRGMCVCFSNAYFSIYIFLKREMQICGVSNYSLAYLVSKILYQAGFMQKYIKFTFAPWDSISYTKGMIA